MQINDRLESTITIDTPTLPAIMAAPSAPVGESTLWVEKYRPKKYLDLLSDETTNRSLLSWLKMWDKVVFNKYVHLLYVLNQSSNVCTFAGNLKLIQLTMVQQIALIRKAVNLNRLVGFVRNLKMHCEQM